MTPAEEEKLDQVLSRLDKIDAKLEARESICGYESDRIGRLEDAVGRQNLVSAVLGALGAGIVLMIQTVFKR